MSLNACPWPCCRHLMGNHRPRMESNFFSLSFKNMQPRTTMATPLSALLDCCLPPSPQPSRCELLSLPLPYCPLLSSVSSACLCARRLCLIFHSHHLHQHAVLLQLLVCHVKRALRVASLTSLFLLFRVQNLSNTISWTYTSGDPTPVDIIVTNGNNATLNGDFSIARFVAVSQEVCLARCLYIQRLICEFRRSL
jgi:hypothetical protein